MKRINVKKEVFSVSRKYKIFIDGQEGTTGLQLYERFAHREDLEILQIDQEHRKDLQARKEQINASDITFLCLPDAAAKESVSLVENDHTRIIDASTAHRTAPGWTYGFPELSPAHRQALKESKRTANPGCYASGFLSLAYPLIAHGIMPPDYPAVCHGISGYSGGGKKMIAQYESPQKPSDYFSPRQYGLTLSHKHLPEMQKISGMTHPPIFHPIVDDYFCGMAVTLPLYASLLSKKVTPKDIQEILAGHYAGQKFVKVLPLMGEGVITDGFVAANTLAGTNHMEIFVGGNEEQILLISRFDNLGKGASGAAVQCMNIMLGLEEDIGL